MQIRDKLTGLTGLDDEDRIADFFARHGGPGTMREREANRDQDTRGWSEVFAADGYKLRCEWSKSGSKTAMNFSEIPP